MRYRSWVGALCSLMAAGLTWSSVPSAAADDGALELQIQPVVPLGASAHEAGLLRALGEEAGAWLARVSKGKAAIDAVSVRPEMPAPSASCLDLASVVAHSRQADAGEDATRVLYVGQSDDCPYLGLAETPGRWLLVPSLARDRAATVRTLVHELGHTFGLQHAGALTCPILTDLPDPSRTCELDEYGDRTDTMGRGATEWGLGPLTLDQAGWGDGLVEITTPGSHVLNVKPLAAEGADGITFTDPVTGDRYALAYRSAREAAGGRVDTADPAAGVFLYRFPRVDEEQVGSVLVPWLTSLTRPRGGKPGFTFVAPSGAVSLHVDALAARFARVTLRLDPAATLVDRAGPVFAEGKPRLKGGMLRVPRAFDQSGIRGYSILVGGKVIQRLAPSLGNVSRTVALPASPRRGLTVAVKVTDLKGNATTVDVLRG